MTRIKPEPVKFACLMGCGTYGPKIEMHQIKIGNRVRHVCPGCVKKNWGVTKGDGIPDEYKIPLPLE